MPKYAANTNVTSELSRLEIERTLIRYGASGFMYATTQDKAMIAFSMNDRQIRFILPLPPMDDFKFTPGRGLLRSEKSQLEAWEQA